MAKRGFWSACEILGDPATVEAEWKQLAGDDYEAARTFLRPAEELATSYPCLRSYACGCYHQVVIHSDDDIVAVCTCNPRSCETISLSKSDIIIYELDRAKLHRTIADALSLETGCNDISQSKRVLFVGSFSPCAGCQVPAYFAITCGCDDFRNVVLSTIAKSCEPFILITPTGEFCDTDCNEILARNNSMNLALSDILVIDENGSFAVDQLFVEMIRKYFRRAFCIDESNESQPLNTISKDIFDQKENYRIIRFHGQQLDALSKAQTEVVRILHSAFERNHPEMTFGSIAVQMTNPPRRMSDIFRYNDSRKVLVKWVKTDIYRLNI